MGKIIARTGLFEGPFGNGRRWYVTDPAGDPAATESAFRAAFEPHARTRWQVLIHYLAGWSMFVGVVSLAVLLGLAMTWWGSDPSLRQVVVGLAGLFAVGGGFLLAVEVWTRVYPRPQMPDDLPENVIAIDYRLAEWGAHQPQADIWTLAFQMRRMEDLADPEMLRALSRVSKEVAEILDSALTEHWLVERRKLRALGERLGFELPPPYADDTPEDLMISLAD